MQLVTLPPQDAATVWAQGNSLHFSCSLQHSYFERFLEGAGRPACIFLDYLHRARNLLVDIICQQIFCTGEEGV